MRKDFMRAFALFAAFALAGGSTAIAQNGQPHSLTAETHLSDVTLSWKAPAEKIALQWHNDYAYNGMDGKKQNPEGSVTFYAASKFTASELKNFVGEQIDSIGFYEFRPVYQVTALIYENGKVVSETPADLSNYKKDSWRMVGLKTPYTIKAGTEVMFALKYVYGYNSELTAICDNSASVGKGNLYSYDGKTWNTDAPGNFLITAYLNNKSTQEPTGYNVYRDGAKANTAALTETTCTLKGEPDGTHSYKVAAIYADGEKESYTVSARPLTIWSKLPQVPAITSSVDDLTDTLRWASPLQRGAEMTWSNKTFRQAIGSSATKNAKVWIKQAFTTDDMAAFPNHKLTAINAYVGSENGITGVVAFVMRNDTIVYSDTIAAETVSAITAGAWNKFTLKTPYTFVPGNSYAFGLYYAHTAKKHPAGVDNGISINNRGNMFSTSSPSSKGFNLTKPTWKTLSSGSIAGNLMLTGDMEALSEAASAELKITGYDLYRDDSLLAKDLTSLQYIDSVSEPGTHSYSVVAKSADGRISDATTINMTYGLPSAYVAPIIISKKQEGKNIKLQWSPSAYEMQHYYTASNITGFDEELTALYGAKFTKEELKPYVGYKFYSIKFGIGANTGDFKIEVRNSKNEVLLSEPIKEGEIQPGYLYTITFDGANAATIPADEDLYICYNATMPANANVMLLDNGPAVDGGAMISVTDGKSWMKLGTLATSLKNYNVVIGAMAVATDDTAAAGAPAKVALSTESLNTALMERSIIEMPDVNAMEAAEEESTFGVDATHVRKSPAKAAEKPQPKSYNVYRNGEKVYSGSATTLNDVLPDYGVFDYSVSTVYENGWESDLSSAVEFSSTISQKLAAPYDLSGNAADGKTLKLTWTAGGNAPELSYQHDGEDIPIGMTGSGTREGYHVIKFKAGDMADKVGQKVQRIRFKLAETDLNSASVVVMYGENIMREQEVSVSSLVAGWNTVVLNQPIEVPAGQDISVGYHIQYKSGMHPIVLDNEPAVSGYSDLISASGSPGYWYSLAEKYNQNHNYRIATVLEKADTAVVAKKAAKASASETYNVYLDGVKLNSTPISGTEYSIANAASGKYTVTAVSGEDESSESNAVNYTAGTTGINEIENNADATLSGNVYTIDGRLVSSDAAKANLKKGIYIVGAKKIVVE